MTYGEAILYGAVQGVTEYLPISSSAHLILLPKFLGTDDPGLTFDVFLHLGTLVATLLYFRREWFSIFAGVFKKPVPGSVQWKWIGIATVPALAAGAVFHGAVETSLRGNLVQMIALTLGGILLWAVDRFMPIRKELRSMGVREALGIGLMQCLALIPGMSRSGMTMTGGRLCGLDRPSAARFSFLISAPITGAALVFELRHWRELLESAVGVGPLLCAGVSSFVFGWLAIGGLLKLLKHFGFGSFAIYRVALAVVIYAVLGI